MQTCYIIILHIIEYKQSHSINSNTHLKSQLRCELNMCVKSKRTCNSTIKFSKCVDMLIF